MKREPITLDLEGNIVPLEAKGLIYLCKYHYGPPARLEIKKTIYFQSPSECLEAYCNIPNPESQMACQTKSSSFQEELKKLHNRLNNQEYIDTLGDCL